MIKRLSLITGENQIIQTEDLRKSLQDLRLNIMLWIMQLEEITSKVERLELIMSLQNEEEVEAENCEAY
jgi:hypothetical protein